MAKDLAALTGYKTKLYKIFSFGDIRFVDSILGSIRRTHIRPGATRPYSGIKRTEVESALMAYDNLMDCILKIRIAIKHTPSKLSFVGYDISEDKYDAAIQAIDSIVAGWPQIRQAVVTPCEDASHWLRLKVGGTYDGNLIPH